MRSSRLVVVLVLALSGLVVVGAPSTAQDDGCGPDEVTVLVDAEALGGATDARCVGVPDPATMLAAFDAAGFAVEGTTEFGSSVVCRVDGAPGPDVDPCVAMPSADAYWVSWIADGDDAWAYAQDAVDAQPVAGGDVVALAFQDGPDEQPPSLTPQEAVDSASPGAGEESSDEMTDILPGWREVAIAVVPLALLAGVLVLVLRRRRG